MSIKDILYNTFLSVWKYSQNIVILRLVSYKKEIVIVVNSIFYKDV